jgi:uncharacterized membrane protein YsdA (DUF1294 family)
MGCIGGKLPLRWLIMWRMLWRVYLVMSILTFVVYGIDKFLAQAEWKRVPERWLHTLSIMGGFPGALAGMHLFHHKKNKPKIRWVIIASGILHIAAFVIVMARLSWF